jgi:signal transduction histidine kinase/CheY-like chemotaxis protein/HPt (histidine-containing phosphotransfer) domain-containing protein
MWMNIRSKLASAFAVALFLSLGIGAIGGLSVRDTGRLVLDMYDRPLQAINYARSAQTSFVILDLEVERALRSDKAPSKEFMDELQQRNGDFLTDLQIAEERGIDPDIPTYANLVRSQNIAWLKEAQEAMAPDMAAAEREQRRLVLESSAEAIISNLEFITQIAAQDGYKFRQDAETAVADTQSRVILAAATSLGLMLIVTIFLIRDIVVPLKDITKVTVRLSSGDLETKVPYDARRDEIGAVARALGIFRTAMLDVSDARKKAEEATKAKSEFLAMMSHEIRTPMNGVLGLTRLLLKTRLDQEQKKLASTVLESGQSLLRILNDILDFSKLEAGKADIEILDFELASLVAGTGMLLRNRADEKGLWFKESVSHELPGYLKGDPNRIRQVLLNLVGNAIKFTEKGGVSVHCRAVAAPDAGALSDADKTMVRIEVQDTGIGISEQARQRLFSSFAQADSSITRRFGGTGLGLAICKKLIEAMGGRIGVDSEPGQGSCFWFEIPLIIGSAAAVSAAAEKEELSIPDQLRILIADDNLVNRKVLAGLLGEKRHRIAFAENGEEAVSAVMQANPGFDLILMDVHMPKMDGMTATRQIRAMGEATKDILIIAATASVSSEGIQRCLAAGMNGYINKPIDPANLNATLNRLFAHASMRTDAGVVSGQGVSVAMDEVRSSIGKTTRTRAADSLPDAFDIPANDPCAIHADLDLDREWTKTQGVTGDAEEENALDAVIPVSFPFAFGAPATPPTALEEKEVLALEPLALDAMLEEEWQEEGDTIAENGSSPLALMDEATGPSDVDADACDQEVIDGMVRDMGVEIALDLIDTFAAILPDLTPALTSMPEASLDCEAIKEAAHSLKSAAGSLGLMLVYRRATAVEKAGKDGDAALCAALLPLLERDLAEGVAWLDEQRGKLASADAA